MKVLVLMVFVAGMTAGCVPIPLLPGGEIYSLENDIEDLVDNSATKNEVISELGIPIRYSKTSMSYKACREPGGVGFFIFFGYQGGYQEVRGDIECFDLVLEFDDHNHLRGYKEEPYTYYKSTYEEREKQILDLAEQGIHEAQYQLYNRSSTSLERLKWICRAADSGYAPAQAEVGRLYRWGLLGVTPDYQRAYQWYWRANRQAPNSWKGELNEIRQTASKK